MLEVCFGLNGEDEGGRKLEKYESQEVRKSESWERQSVLNVRDVRYIA